MIPFVCLALMAHLLRRPLLRSRISQVDLSRGRFVSRDGYENCRNIDVERAQSDVRGVMSKSCFPLRKTRRKCGRRDGGGIWRLNPFGPGTSTITSIELYAQDNLSVYLSWFIMSRNFIPAVLAIGMGVFTGMHLYTVRMQPTTDMTVSQDTTPSSPH